MKHLITISTIILSGCGAIPSGNKDANDDGATAQSSRSGMQSLAIASAADLPPCTDANNQQLIYVKLEAQFYTCDAGQWTTIAIKGEQGEAGPAGPQGDTGTAG